MRPARSGIRARATDAVTGLLSTGDRVSEWRLNAAGADDLPNLTLKFGKDQEHVSDDIDNALGVREVRDLPLTIEISEVQRGDKDNANTLTIIDTICAEVETGLTGYTPLTNGIDDVRLLTTEIEMTGGGEWPVAVATQEWIIRYTVDRTNP